MKETSKYHSTGQFRNAVSNLQKQSKFLGVPAPKLKYIGTVKTHGTNASIRLHADGCISFHSKNNTLGYVDAEGSVQVYSDNAGFCVNMLGKTKK